ncbi:hypothetical protein ZWY2020_058067 [Hordeum vulgare]|nr:hypothetical protein ZWY2020_058067 [Hordeum vulgare]
MEMFQQKQLRNNLRKPQLENYIPVEIVMAFEEEFSFEIPDNEAEKIDSIKSAVDFIASHPQANMGGRGVRGGGRDRGPGGWAANLVIGASAQQQLQPKAREGQWHRQS